MTDFKDVIRREFSDRERDSWKKAVDEELRPENVAANKIAGRMALIKHRIAEITGKSLEEVSEILKELEDMPVPSANDILKIVHKLRSRP